MKEEVFGLLKWSVKRLGTIHFELIGFGIIANVRFHNEWFSPKVFSASSGQVKFGRIVCIYVFADIFEGGWK